MDSKFMFLGFCVLQVALAQRTAEIKCHAYINSAYQKIIEDPVIQELKVACRSIFADMIIGGQEAGVGEFPHQAVLGYPKKDLPKEIEFFCGGSLISDRYVLTAAHCKYDLKMPIVRLGEYNLFNETDGQQNYEVARFIQHPEYKPSYSYHDIALVQLTQEVKFNDRIRPACLWTTELFNMSSAVASGFGLTRNSNNNMSSKLMKVKLNVLGEVNCTNNFEYDMLLERGLTAQQLCAGQEGGKDTCNGDSGGPLQVILDVDTRVHHVVGITTFGGRNCGVGNSAAVYTRVASYLDWIEEEVW